MVSGRTVIGLSLGPAINSPELSQSEVGHKLADVWEIRIIRGLCENESERELGHELPSGVDMSSIPYAVAHRRCPLLC